MGTTLWSANVGDSRVVLGRDDGSGGITAVDLTTDQNPDTYVLLSLAVLGWCMILCACLPWLSALQGG